MDPPSVFVLVGDCLRAANVDSRTMPFATEFADVQFDRCYAPATWTLPSHASLYSLRTPAGHDVTRRGDTLAATQAALPTAASDAGYETALFSENPTFSTQTGFDHGVDFVDDSIHLKPLLSRFAGENHVDAIDASAALTLLREVARRPDRGANLLNLLYGLVEKCTDDDPVAYPHHGDRVMDHIGQYVRSNSRRPILCIANLLDTHNPHHAPPEEGAAALELTIAPPERRALGAANDNRRYVLTDEAPPEATRPWFDTWDAVFSRRLDVYNAQIRYLDALLERWAADVEERLTDSLLIVTGDHGQLFGEEGMVGHHTSLHPHGIHVPLFVRFPSSWTAVERTVATPVSLVGLATAVRRVVEGDVDSGEAFVSAVEDATAGRTDDGRVVVCADGPTWRVPTLRDEYDDALVDDLAVRRVGFVDEERMEVYSCRWGSSTVEGSEYRLRNGGREHVGEIEPPAVDVEYREWLVAGEASDVTAETNARLEALGYR